MNSMGMRFNGQPAPCGCRENVRENVRENARERVRENVRENVPINQSCQATDKNSVMRNVYELGFVMTEALLYLDTHPNDAEAIEYYNSMRERYNEAVAAYESVIGPLTFNSTGAENYFNWAATPLPWEKEGC